LGGVAVVRVRWLTRKTPVRTALALVTAFQIGAMPAIGRAGAEPSQGEVPAAPAAADPTAKFDRAEDLYREGRYDEAIALLEELVAEYPDAILLYNLGRAHESAGRLEEAISAYERYLAAAPDAADAEAVQRRIERLRARKEPPPPEPPADSEPPPPPEPRRPRPIVVPWIVAGAGAAGLVAGATLGGLSRTRTNEARDEQGQTAAADKLDDARRFATAANIAFAVGGVLAVAGLAWGIAAVTIRRRAATSVKATALGIAVAF
jgi:tetratricopeptide (TPR) repeat protein